MVDSVPADALLRNAEEADTDYPNLKLANDVCVKKTVRKIKGTLYLTIYSSTLLWNQNMVESLLSEIAELLQFTWYLKYQNTPHARYMEKIVRSSHDWAQHWAQATSAGEKVTSEVLHRRYDSGCADLHTERDGRYNYRLNISFFC